MRDPAVLSRGEVVACVGGWWALFLATSIVGIVYGAVLIEWLMAPAFEPLRTCSGAGCGFARLGGMLSFVTGPALIVYLRRVLRPTRLLLADSMHLVLDLFICLALAIATTSLHQLWALPSVR